MNEEKKVYSIVGRVEIGTDEYRDLIEASINAQNETSEMQSKWINEYRRANKLEKELNELNERSKKAFNFIEASEETNAKFKLWLIEQEEN